MHAEMNVLHNLWSHDCILVKNRNNLRNQPTFIPYTQRNFWSSVFCSPTFTDCTSQLILPINLVQQRLITFMQLNTKLILNILTVFICLKPTISFIQTYQQSMFSCVKSLRRWCNFFGFYLTRANSQLKNKLIVGLKQALVLKNHPLGVALVLKNHPIPIPYGEGDRKGDGAKHFPPLRGRGWCKALPLRGTPLSSKNKQGQKNYPYICELTFNKRRFYNNSEIFLLSAMFCVKLFGLIHKNINLKTLNQSYVAQYLPNKNSLFPRKNRESQVNLLSQVTEPQAFLATNRIFMYINMALTKVKPKNIVIWSNANAETTPQPMHNRSSNYRNSASQTSNYSSSPKAHLQNLFNEKLVNPASF